MALPTKTDQITLDYGSAGTPFADVVAQSTIDTTTMDYGYSGTPFVTNPDSTPAPAGPAHLKTMFGVAVANIKTVNGIPLANIKTLDGLV